MKPDAWEASPPPPRELRPREPRPRLPVIPVRVFLTVSMSAPEPLVRLFPPRGERVLLVLAMPLRYPVKRLQTGVS